jgi:hypothetical protein
MFVTNVDMKKDPRMGVINLPWAFGVLCGAYDGTRGSILISLKFL